MLNDNETKDYTKISSINASSTLKFEPTVIQHNITAVNDISTSLSISMPRSRFFTDYTDVISTQKNALNSIIVNTKEISVNEPSLSMSTARNLGSVSTAIADIGLTKVNTAKLFDSGLIDQTQLAATEKISSSVLGIVHEYQDITTRVNTKSVFEDIESKAITVQPTQIIGNGISSIMTALPTYPLDQSISSLQTLRTSVQISSKMTSEHQGKLDQLLKAVDPELVENRTGAWETFNRKGPDYIGQSASSMRRLVDNLMYKLAPDEAVSKTTFYSTKYGNKDGRPTRKARLRYIVKFEEKKEAHTTRLIKSIDSFLEVYNNLPTWDHRPLNKDMFVYGTFITIEGLLLSILCER